MKKAVRLFGLSWLVFLVMGGPGCARDRQMIAWESDLVSAQKHEIRGNTAVALDRYRELEKSSLTAVDADRMRLAQARVLLKEERIKEAANLYETVSNSAKGRRERARARYELGVLLASVTSDRAVLPYLRRLVLTFPDLMPGSTALLRLQAAAAEGSTQERLEHLNWSLAHYDRLSGTGLGDNLLYFAAREAVRNFHAGDVYAEETARILLQAVVDRHPMGNSADDALRDLSYLEESQGDWEETIRHIRSIQRRRETMALLGSHQHRFYWMGDLRIARILGEKLQRPTEAIALYRRFVDTYGDSIWRDDALYWMGCLHQRLKETKKARILFDRILKEEPESRYTQRIQAALDAPASGSCIPREFQHTW